MRASHRLTPKAAEGLWRIVQFVAERFDQDSAERVLDQLEEAFERLAEHPGIGHRRTNLTAEADVRFWSVGPTVIAFLKDRGASKCFASSLASAIERSCCLDTSSRGLSRKPTRASVT